MGKSKNRMEKWIYNYKRKLYKIQVTLEASIDYYNNKIILYNDGEHIADDLLDGIFTPFRKGIKGEFGLGLSVVKKSLVMMGYDIEVKNHINKFLRLKPVPVIR